MTLEERDRSGTEQCPAATDVLREIVDHHSLVDIWRDHHPDDVSTFTFVRVEAHRSRHSRLDRIYLSQRPEPAYWHFNNSLLEDVGFVASFQEFWLACRRRDAAIGQLEREVLELERPLAASPENPSLCGACREKQEELRALEDHQARGAFVRSCIRLLREMDRGSRFFYALEKKRGAKKHVTCLLTEDGTPLTDPTEMCGRARAFYAGLSSPDPTDPNACRVLWDEFPMVSAGETG
ncbi:unnamed protein product [Caretta caretta]